MTEPQPVMAQAEQDQLTRQVGRALLSAAGDGWQQVRAEYRSAGRHIEVDVFVKGPDGVERPVRPPQEVVDGLGRLRQGMYRPGRGTWLSALYILDPPSAFSAEFEPDVEPQWRRVPPPIGFADELRFFPRGDEHIPEWLRQRAGLPPAPDADAGQENAAGTQAGHRGGPAGPGAPAGPAGPGGLPMRPGGAPVGPGGGQARPGERPFGGQSTPPYGTPRQHGAPTPPPGIPATPYGAPGSASGDGPASPPRGFAPPAAPRPAGPLTPPPGVPAGPFTAPPGVPAGPYVGGGDTKEPENGWGPASR